MHGNVWEWCHDVYGEDYYKQSPEKDPTGPTSGSIRLYRGGAWLSKPEDIRSASRWVGVGEPWGPTVGFRVVRELD